MTHPASSESLHAAAREILILAERSAQVARLAGLVVSGVPTSDSCSATPEIYSQMTELNEARENGIRLLLGDTPSRDAQIAVMSHEEAYAAAQDRIERDRNHFVKGFRSVHGTDRSAFSPEAGAEYDRVFADFRARKAKLLDAAARAICEDLARSR